jgi:hypothetical protein
VKSDSLISDAFDTLCLTAMKDAHMEKVLGVRFGPEISFGFESKILDLTASSDKISKTQKIEKSSQNIYLMLDYFLTY